MSAAAAWPARTARFCWMAWYAASGAVESDATGGRPDTQVVVALGGSQRQRARRYVEPHAGEEPRGDDRLGERQRDSVPPGRAHDDVRVAPGGAGAALRLGNERQREPVLLDRGPERVRPHVRLGRLAQLSRDALGEEARHDVGEDRAPLVHCSGDRETGINRRWTEIVTLSSVVPGSARPAPIVGDLSEVRVASSEPEPPRDDAAQDFARATAERERRSALDW